MHLETAMAQCAAGGKFQVIVSAGMAKKNATSQDRKKNKSCNLLGQKSHSTSQYQKESRNLSGQKKSRNLLVHQQNHATSWGKKCPKNSNLSHNQTSGDRHRSPWSCSVLELQFLVLVSFSCFLISVMPCKNSPIFASGGQVSSVKSPPYQMIYLQTNKTKI